MNSQEIIESTVTNRWKRYPAYKSSSIEWLGEIPIHWDVKRIKCLFSVVNGSTPKSDMPEYWDGDILWVTPEDLGRLDTDTITTTGRNITKQGYLSCGTTMVPSGSLVLSTRAPIGHVAIAGVSLCTNQGCRCLVIRGNNCDTRYFYYQLISGRSEIESWGQGSTFKELSKGKLEAVLLCHPLKVEQQAIVCFLNREIAKIDALIAKKERLIELLQEKRTALISHAVTKGLDPTVPMKDSGVEWLGEIPEHWGVYKVKQLSVRIQTGTTPPTSEERYYEDGTVPWYGPGSFGEKLNLTQPVKLIASSAIKERVARLFSSGSTLVVVIGATIGKVGYINHEASTNQQITAITFNHNIVDSKYAAYQMKRLEPVLRGIAPSTTLPILDQQEIGDLPFALPPKEEQADITSYIDNKTSKIDSLISKIKQVISQLNEYRTALISAAVTGKIDVREEVF